MRPFKVGVIGIGDISGVYIDNLNQYGIVEVAACAGRDLEKARRKATEHGIPRACATGNEVIEDPEIDIVLNLTTPAAHAEYNIAALNAGKHVYSEKPLAATLEEARNTIDLADKKNLCVGCAPDTFLGSRLQTCREIIDSGTIGEVTAASAFVVSQGHEWHHPNPDFFYQPGAGPLLDIGPYYITALLSLMGPVARCCAMSKRTFNERVIHSEPRRGQTVPVEVDTHITGSLEFENGAIGTIITSFDVWDSELPRIEIYGTRGTLCIKDVDPLSGPNLFGGPLLLMTESNYRWTSQPRPEPLSDWITVPIERPFDETSHQKNSRGIGLVDMAYALREGRDPRASGAMAFHSLETMYAVLNSARARRFVEVESTFTRPDPLPLGFPEGE